MKGTTQSLHDQNGGGSTCAAVAAASKERGVKEKLK